MARGATAAIVVGLIFVAGVAMPRRLSAQSRPPAAPVASPLRVFLICEPCDLPSFVAGAGFVDFVGGPAGADVQVFITDLASTASTSWTMAFTGLGRLDHQDRILGISLPRGATPDQTRRELARLLRVGLADYAVGSRAGSQLAVVSRAPARPPDSASPQSDPWRAWTFSVGLNGSHNAESLTSNGYYAFETSANRVTDRWKVQTSTSRNVSTSSYVIGDNDTFRSDTVDWNASGLLVRSLNARWSLGVAGSARGSTYSNEAHVVSAGPAFEFDVFPYQESSRRSLTLQYIVGASSYRYLAQTVYGRLSEVVPRHALTASLGLRQRWGQVGSFVQFSQRLDSPHQHHLSVTGDARIRLFGGFSVTATVSVSRIRDQFTLPRGEATEEEVLLHLRQLATGHRYGATFGFSYRFGSLSNGTVNPRFGG